MGLCVLTNVANVQEMRLDDVIPLEKSVHVVHLSNGVKTYIQRREFSPRSGAFRVVLRKASREEVQYSYEGSLDSLEKAEQFFAHCKEKIIHDSAPKEISLDFCNYSCSDLPSLGLESPAEMAVIAVGDFAPQEIEDLMEKYFADVVFSQNAPDSDTAAIQIGYDEAISKVALSVSYPSLRISIDTYEDLKESWKFLLLQELFQQRMERCSRGLDEMWVHPHPCFFYPVNGYSYASEDSSENLLAFLLWQVEAIRSDGFSEEEFYMAKRKMINQLQYLSFNASQPNDSFLASYYADQFLLGDRCHCYQSFLDASADRIQEIHSEDLYPYLDLFFLDENRQIKVVYPRPKHAEILTKEKIENMISRIASLASFYRESEIDDDSDLNVEIKETLPGPSNKAKPPKDSFQFINLKKEDVPAFRLVNNHAAPPEGGAVDPTHSFYQLPLDDREKRFIKSIVTTIAEKNILQLAFEKRTLEKKGDKIHHVHPLRFMGYILGTSDLKHHLRTIKKSSFKWDAMISGFAKRMREELAKDNVYQHLSGFARQVGSTTEHIVPYIHKRDFDGLVKSLL